MKKTLLAIVYFLTASIAIHATPMQNWVFDVMDAFNTHMPPLMNALDQAPTPTDLELAFMDAASMKKYVHELNNLIKGLEALEKAKTQNKNFAVVKTTVQKMINSCKVLVCKIENALKRKKK